MFNFGKPSKDLDVRDEAIIEMLSLLTNHAYAILKDWEKNKDCWDKETVALATLPILKMGDLKALQKYLKESDVAEANAIGVVLMRISKTVKEKFSKRGKDDK